MIDTTDMRDVTVQLTSVELVGSGYYTDRYVYQFDSVTRNSLTGEYLVDGNIRGRYQSPDSTEGETLSVPLLESNNILVPIGTIVKATPIITRGTFGLEFSAPSLGGGTDTSLTGGVMNSNFATQNDSTFMPTGWFATGSWGALFPSLPNIDDTITVKVALPSDKERKVAVQLECRSYFHVDAPLGGSPIVTQGTFQVYCQYNTVIYWDLGGAMIWPLLASGTLSIGSWAPYTGVKTVVLTFAPGDTEQNITIKYWTRWVASYNYPYLNNPAMKFAACTQVTSITDTSDNSDIWLRETTRSSGGETPCPTVVTVAQYP